MRPNVLGVLMCAVFTFASAGCVTKQHAIWISQLHRADSLAPFRPNSETRLNSKELESWAGAPDVKMRMEEFSGKWLDGSISRGSAHRQNDLDRIWRQYKYLSGDSAETAEKSPQFQNLTVLLYLERRHFKFPFYSHFGFFYYLFLVNDDQRVVESWPSPE